MDIDIILTTDIFLSVVVTEVVGIFSKYKVQFISHC
jgi:hypothetical protein